MHDAPSPRRTPDAAAPSRLRLALVVGGAALVGVVALAAYVPELAAALGEDPGDLPGWLPVAAAIQPAVLVALAAVAGAALAPKVGLHAPVAEAAVTGRSAVAALQPQVVPGIAGGVFGALLLVLLGALAPEAVTSVQARFDPPLYVRVLYGGITEEVLLRWGLMTVFVWAGWRFVQRRDGMPHPAVV